MELPERMMMIGGIIAAFAACLIGLACAAIGAVLRQPEEDAESGEGLVATACATPAEHGFARLRSGFGPPAPAGGPVQNAPRVAGIASFLGR